MLFRLSQSGALRTGIFNCFYFCSAHGIALVKCSHSGFSFTEHRSHVCDVCTLPSSPLSHYDTSAARPSPQKLLRPSAAICSLLGSVDSESLRSRDYADSDSVSLHLVSRVCAPYWRPRTLGPRRKDWMKSSSPLEPTGPWSMGSNQAVECEGGGRALLLSRTAIRHSSERGEPQE